MAGEDPLAVTPIGDRIGDLPARFGFGGLGFGILLFARPGTIARRLSLGRFFRLLFLDAMIFRLLRFVAEDAAIRRRLAIPIWAVRFRLRLRRGPFLSVALQHFIEWQ